MHRTNIHKVLSKILKWVLPIAVITILLFFIPKFETNLSQLIVNSTFLFFYVPLLLLLGLLNRLIESYKWHKLCLEVQDVSFYQSIAVVMSSMAFGFVSPARSGEFISRVALSSSSNRSKLIAQQIISGIYASVITVLIGAIASVIIILFYAQTSILLTSTLQIALLIAFSCLLLLILFNRFNWRESQFYRNLHAKFNFEIQNHGIDKKLFYGLISLSRYFVFLLQYLVLFYALGDSHNFFLSLNLTAILFFASSCIPSFSLGKLGIREALSVVIFVPFGYDAALVISVSFLIWISNQLIPALSGSLIYFFFTKQKA